MSTLATLLATALAACTHLAPTTVEPAGAARSGRLALRVAADADTPARTFSASFELAGDANEGSLKLLNPLGLVAAQASWKPGSVHLVSAEGEQDYANLEALSLATLGEPLPLQALFDWLRGQAWDSAPSQATETGFEQMGWRIDTSELASNGLLLAQRERAPALVWRIRLDQP